MSVEEIDEQIDDTHVKQVDDENATEMEVLPHDKLVQLQGQDDNV